MDWEKFKKWAMYAGISIGAASIAYVLYKGIRSGRYGPTLSDYPTGDEYGGMNPDLTPSEVIEIITQLAENFPNFLR